MEIYRKHRPTMFKQLVGQPEAVNILTNKLKTNSMPHALLLTGPSGCGKTTVVRILAKKLGCVGKDFVEMNCANDARGIETARALKARAGLRPMGGGKVRIWYLDEAQNLTSDCQSGLLKVFEDPPKTAYYMMATTDPEKINAALRNRCTQINLRPLTHDELAELVRSVAKVEKKKLSPDVVDRITLCALGSARRALVLLDQILEIDGEDQQMSAIERSEAQSEGISVAQALFKKGLQWSQMARVLQEVNVNEIEKVRWGVLMYAKGILLKHKGWIQAHAARIIEEFEKDFFQSKDAGLALSCYRIICGK